MLRAEGDLRADCTESRFVAAALAVVLQDNANTYVYGLDLISATDSLGTQTYFVYDGLGSTTALTNGQGGTTGTYTYDAFGAPRTQPIGNSNYWQFTGEQRDDVSGFYYLRARYYDPTLGRFLSRDPAHLGHPYVYAGNNPVNFVDPYGLWGPDLTPDFVDDAWDEVSDSVEAVATKTTVEQIASGIQTISGTIMWISCGAQSAANPLAGGVCVVAAGWYSAATVVKLALADNACERGLVLVTAALGLAPPLKIIGNVIAGASSAVEALGCPTTAYSPGYSAPVNGGSKE